MEFRALGPLEVVVDGEPLALRAPMQRALLAALLVRPNEVISRSELIDALWDDHPPRTAHAALQVHVAQLRKILGRDRIVTRRPGYLLRVDAGELDTGQFEALVSQAREGGPAAAALLREALELWRGRPFAGLGERSFAVPEVTRLEELRLAAEELRIDHDLALGRHAALVPELEAMVKAQPYREGLHARLMIALYRSGRQAEALGAYREARETLVEQLGIEPGAPLRQLERAILEQDPTLDVTSPAQPATGRLGPPPGLRARSTSFVGRKHELRDVRALLQRDDVRLLTLTGPGGSGKTRLAVEAMDGLGEELPDGVVLVDLAPIGDPDLVAGAIADAVGVGERPGRGRMDFLLAFLRDRRALLLLDNFEQLLPAAPLLVDLLRAGPRLKLLVTSRTPLELPEEWIYTVPALALPDPTQPPEIDRLRRTDAVELFIDRARDARPDFELTEETCDAVVELCRRLDGLPLAVELAAARIRLLTPGAILERLGDRLDLLRAAPGSGMPERHRTLRAATEWSYDLLTPDEQALFTSLAVFVGGFTLDGAEAVAGGDELDVVDGVESLLNDNLLRTEPMAGSEPRFGMLQTIREFALERLSDRGDLETVCRLRHAGHYAVLAEEAELALLGPQQLSWLLLLDAELANIRAALSWATETGETETGLRIGTALWRFWQLRGSVAEGRERLERLLARGSGSERARAMAQARLASLALVQGDHEAVRRYGEASLLVLRRIGDDETVSVHLGLLGLSAVAVGDDDRARSLTEESLEIARRTGDLSTEAYAAFNVGAVLAHTGHLDEAERFLEESVRGARQLGNLRSVANWTRALGGIAAARGDIAQARLLFEESLVIHRRLGDPWGTARTLTRLALVSLETHDHDASRHLVAESVAIERDVDDVPGHFFDFEVLARLAAAEGRPARAARLYACASVIRDLVGSYAIEPGWPDHEHHVGRLRSELGAEAFAQAWEHGRAMTLDEALDYALSTDSGSSSS